MSDVNQLWSWALTVVGVTTFILAGRKVWWSWYVGIACQVLWLAYALITEQMGFLVGVVVYTFVYVKNSIAWTKEHRAPMAKASKDMEIRNKPHWKFHGHIWYTRANGVRRCWCHEHDRAPWRPLTPELNEKIESTNVHIFHDGTHWWQDDGEQQLYLCHGHVNQRRVESVEPPPPPGIRQTSL